MTLAPVFRSQEAVNALQEKGYWIHLEDSLAAHLRARDLLDRHLREVIHEKFVTPLPAGDNLQFLQENFFLVLFHSLFKTLDTPPERLELYTLLNRCIRGVVLSGDNLFDDEDKIALPLRIGAGRRFRSIVQMICFQNLIHRVLALYGAWLDADDQTRIVCDLTTRLTEIGSLEGSEEDGVDRVMPVEEMIDHVHRVRGGTLFSLAFIAPAVGEPAETRKAWEKAEKGIRSLGTAFQIVDDITDFEFDLGRRSHNLVAAQMVQDDGAEGKAALKRLAAPPGSKTDLARFHDAASKVVERARAEAEAGFSLLKEVGFWFDPGDALLFVRAIAGDAGFERVQNLKST